MKFNLLLCEVFGHNMYFESWNVAGPTRCVRCGHRQEGIRWPKPEMPTVQLPKKNVTD